MAARSRLALAAGLALGGAVATGIVATGAGESSSPPTTVATTSSSSATTDVPAPPITVRRSSVSTTSTTSTTTTSTTIVPIVTYAADIGVLSPRPVATPTRVVIPALGVDGPVIAAGVNAAAELDVPPDARSLVWYRHGPSPGEPGSAVIAGHLNWRGVQGIFSDLAATPVGEHLTVSYDDGSQRTFAVATVELVDKPAVSVNGVFARDGASVLRLVTCGGEFDDDTRHYRSNVIVTAVPL